MQEMKAVVVLVGLMCVGCAINQRHEVRKPVSRLPALEDVPVASNDHLHKPEPIRHVAAVEEVSDGGLFSGPVSVEIQLVSSKSIDVLGWIWTEVR